MKKLIAQLFKAIFRVVFLNLKLKPDIFSGIFTGVGTGIIANIMFVLTTSQSLNLLNLTISFMLAIIILILGSIEKKNDGKKDK